eukprot:SAG31_NODE_23711_length_498_cov_0.769424_2_plen_77_part_01
MTLYQATVSTLRCKLRASENITHGHTRGALNAAHGFAREEMARSRGNPVMRHISLIKHRYLVEHNAMQQSRYDTAAD